MTWRHSCPSAVGLDKSLKTLSGTHRSQNVRGDNRQPCRVWLIGAQSPDVTLQNNHDCSDTLLAIIIQQLGRWPVHMECPVPPSVLMYHPPNGSLVSTVSFWYPFSQGIRVFLSYGISQTSKRSLKFPFSSCPHPYWIQ